MSGTLARITSQRQAIEAVLQPGAASCCMLTPLGVVSPADRKAWLPSCAVALAWRKRQRVPLDLRDWSRVISALVRQKLAVELPQQRRAHLGGVVVWEAGEAWIGGYREVPYSDEARELIAPWMSLRSVIAPGHDRALLNLHAGPTVRQPMTEFTFSRLLGTYIGPGWTFRRLRDTCALRWVQERVPVLELVDRLGLAVSSIDRFLALAPITTKELAESAKRGEPELMRLMGRRT
jgi:hypothetical protein